MDRLRAMQANADRLRFEDASLAAQSQAYDDVEDAFFKKETFDDFSDEEEEEQMQNVLDYNDSLVRNGNKSVSMNLFYMCAKCDPQNTTGAPSAASTCRDNFGTAGGASPETTRAWYCGLQQCEWEKIVQKHSCSKQDQPRTPGPSTWTAYSTQRRKTWVPSSGSSPSQNGASMVLEVTDKTVSGTIT